MHSGAMSAAAGACTANLKLSSPARAACRAPAARHGFRKTIDAQQQRYMWRRRWRHVPTPAAAAGGGGGANGGKPEQQPAAAPPAKAQEPAANEVEYKDGPTDIAFIALCRIAYGNIAGWQSSRSWTDGPETFRGMVEVSRALMMGRSAAQQRDAVIRGFPEVPAWFRRVFPYSKWGAELNARITPTFFAWLVGPMQTAEATVDGGVVQQSAVKIQRCRYLAESGCAAMCVNLCKAPVQEFFTEQLGMPLTMTPNFEDSSCEMVFGKRPPPLSEDPVATQPCLAACATAMVGSGPCHKLE